MDNSAKSPTKYSPKTHSARVSIGLRLSPARTGNETLRNHFDGATLLSKDSWSRRNASFQLPDSVLVPAEIALLSRAEVGSTVFDPALPISDSQALRIKLYSSAHREASSVLSSPSIIH